jgi:hypothetical protein
MNGRKIDLHSFRDIYAAHMAVDKVAKVNGHRSGVAVKIYQDHVTSRILKEAEYEVAKELGNILQVAKQGA